jgi:hypothetical protein
MVQQCMYRWLRLKDIVVYEIKLKNLMERFIQQQIKDSRTEYASMTIFLVVGSEKNVTEKTCVELAMIMCVLYLHMGMDRDYYLLFF